MINLSSGAKNQVLASIAALFNPIISNGGAVVTPSQIMIYTGAPPANGDASPTGTLLCTIQFPSAPHMAHPNPFSAPANGIVTVYPTVVPLGGPVVATGTAGWFRVVAANGSPVFDGTVTASGSGGDLLVDSTTFGAGGVITLQSIAIT